MATKLHCPGCQQTVGDESLVWREALAQCPQCQYTFLMPQLERNQQVVDSIPPSTHTKFVMLMAAIGGGVLLVCCGGCGILSLLTPAGHKPPAPAVVEHSPEGATNPAVPVVVAPAETTLNDNQKLDDALRRLFAPSSSDEDKERALNTIYNLPVQAARQKEMDQAVAEHLQHNSEDVRNTASLVLLKWGTPAIVPAVIATLRQPDSGVERSCFEFLEKHARTAEAEQIATFLPDAEKRFDAQRVLVAIGPSAEDAVLPYLANKDDQELRTTVLSILRRIGGSRSLTEVKRLADFELDTARRTDLQTAARSIETRLGK